jgi:HK97 family phage major capsid protein
VAAVAVGKDELRAELQELIERRQEIDTEYAGKRFPQEIRDQFNVLCDDIKDREETLEELERREQILLKQAQKPDNIETVEMPQFPRPGVARGNDIWDLSTVRRSFDDPELEGKELKDRAKRAVEQVEFRHPKLQRQEAQTQVERLIDTVDNREGLLARYLLMTGSKEYSNAFGKYLQQAPRSPHEDQLLYRAASLTTTAGGFAVPFVLDPSVIQTGSGAINPYRSIANVTQQSVDEWRGVSSAGITATFQAEASAVTDAAATLAQPTVSTEMARAFVPFSIEIGQDWATFQSEMTTMFADAKDVLEATKFAVGSGTNEPFGVITGATTVFTAAGTNALVVADIYGVHNALGPRFRRNATWTLNNAVADRIRQLDTAGGANLWVQNLTLRSAAVPNSFTDGRMGADLLGKGTYEATGQSGTFTTGQLIGVVGDFNYYKIVDRIGLNVEVIPHIFGAAQGNLPTGQRGLFAYWRVGAKVLDANAFRTLKLA